MGSPVVSLRLCSGHEGNLNWYKKKTGNWRAHRDNFADVVDFIGWYGSMSHTTLGISKWDARNQYLAYHEGHGAINVKPIRGNAGSWRWRKRSSVTRLATEHSWHAVSTTSITRDGFRTSSPTVAMLLEVLPPRLRCCLLVRISASRSIYTFEEPSPTGNFPAPRNDPTQLSTSRSMPLFKTTEGCYDQERPDSPVCEGTKTHSMISH